MAPQSYRDRHAQAMLHPETPEEQTLVVLYTELAKIGDRHKDDYVLVKAAEALGSAIIVLLNGDTGRIDQASLDKMVRDVVERAGGDSSEL